MKTLIKCPEQLQPLLEDLRKLKRDGQNPNKMNKDQKDALWKSLLELGWKKPIVTNLDGLIADGEQRITVCLDHKENYGPVLRTEMTEVERKLIRQALNKISGKHDIVLDALEFSRIITQGRKDALKSILTLNEEKLQCILSVAGKRNFDFETAWTGMPEFLQKDLLGRVIKVHFKKEEDVQDFAELIGQTITDKTRFLWFPYVEHQKMTKGVLSES